MSRCQVGLILGLLRALTRPGLFDPVTSFLLQRHQHFLIEASLEERALPINSGVRTVAIHAETLAFHVQYVPSRLSESTLGDSFELRNAHLHSIVQSTGPGYGYKRAPKLCRPQTVIVSFSCPT